MSQGMPVTKLSRLQVDSFATGVTRTYRISLTSAVDGYTVRVLEIRPGRKLIPVFLCDAPRRVLSAPSFHRLRFHYRGELVGEVIGQLKHGNPQPIDKMLDIVSPSDCDCYIRYELADATPDGYPNAGDDDLSDLTHWREG